MNKNFNYRGYDVYVKFGEYEQGGISMQLFSSEEGPVDVLTVNLLREGIVPLPDEVVIKASQNGSENNPQLLIDNGIIEELGRKVYYGFENSCVAYVSPLTEDAFKAWKES